MINGAKFRAESIKSHKFPGSDKLIEMFPADFKVTQSQNERQTKIAATEEFALKVLAEVSAGPYPTDFTTKALSST